MIMVDMYWLYNTYSFGNTCFPGIVACMVRTRYTQKGSFIFPSWAWDNFHLFSRHKGIHATVGVHFAEVSASFIYIYSYLFIGIGRSGAFRFPSVYAYVNI